jgi:hypothetical protein
MFYTNYELEVWSSSKGSRRRNRSILVLSWRLTRACLVVSVGSVSACPLIVGPSVEQRVVRPPGPGIPIAISVVCLLFLVRFHPMAVWLITGSLTADGLFACTPISRHAYYSTISFREALFRLPYSTKLLYHS